MALPQTPRISIKYSITVKGERETERRGEGKGDRWKGKKIIKSTYPYDPVEATISQFLIEKQNPRHTFDGKVKNIAYACKSEIFQQSKLTKNSAKCQQGHKPQQRGWA